MELFVVIKYFCILIEYKILHVVKWHKVYKNQCTNISFLFWYYNEAIQNVTIRRNWMKGSPDLSALSEISCKVLEVKGYVKTFQIKFKNKEKIKSKHWNHSTKNDSYEWIRCCPGLVLFVFILSAQYKSNPTGKNASTRLSCGQVVAF